MQCLFSNKVIRTLLRRCCDVFVYAYCDVLEKIIIFGLMSVFVYLGNDKNMTLKMIKLHVECMFDGMVIYIFDNLSKDLN